jgi:predicted methyltransferase
MKSIPTVALLLALAASPALLAGDSLPKFLTSAVADQSRPPADTLRDPQRKPAECMAFAGVKPKMTVIELIPGGGYYTRLLSKAVGPQGHLYAVVPALPADAPAGTPDRSLPIKAIASDPGYHNVSVDVEPIRAMHLTTEADLAWTSDNYHDLHNAKDFDILAFNKAVFAALKPGGTYLIIDHEAAADAPPDVTSTLHRIRSATVIQEVTAAGFTLEAKSDILHNAGDSHALKIFDPDIKGKTDQFVLRFKKPR